MRDPRRSTLQLVSALALSLSSAHGCAPSSQDGNETEAMTSDGGIEKALGTTSACVLVTDTQLANLSCPSGSSIQSIDFASYGTPTGSCATGLTVGSCHASTPKP